MRLHRPNCGFVGFVLLLVCFSACRAEEKNEELTEEEKIVVEKWKASFENIRKGIGKAIKSAMPYFMDSMYDQNLTVSQGCKRGLFQWIADLKAGKPYALRLFDASAKIIDGILTGSFSAFGSFDQCIQVVHPKGTFRGKYCTVENWPDLPPKPRFYSSNQRLKAFKQFENDTGMIGEFTKHVQLFYLTPLRRGICVPSVCSTEDISSIAKIITKKFLTMHVTVPRCEVAEKSKIENFQVPILCVISILVTLVICGTLYDILVYKKRKDDSKDIGIWYECLMAFSANKNWKKLVDLNAGQKDLSVLHGIRFFTMCWIILGHTYYHVNSILLRHLQIAIELTTQFIFNAVTNASFTVDNFFFMSGLLVIYVTKDVVEKTGKVPGVGSIILHRLWRLLPIQMFFVGIGTLLPLFGSGPVWHESIDPIVEGCRKDWWANMIFINNIYRSTVRGCLSYTWYLATDFQIYVFTIPIVILIVRKPRIGLWVNFAVLVISVIAIAIHNYIRDLPPALLLTRADPEQRAQLMREALYNPYRHIGPYCIGMFVGHYLQAGSRPIKMHWSLHLAAWISTFSLTSLALFGIHPWNQPYEYHGIVAAMFYASLSKIAWTLGLAWITIACTKGYGGIMGSILRSKICIPFSRLTFMVYMVHPLVQYVFYAVLREGIQAKNHLAIFTCFGFIVSSYGLALLASIFVESPFINLGKIIFNRRESFKRKNIASSLDSQKTANTHKESGNWMEASVPTQFMNSCGKNNEAFDTQENDLVIRVNGKTFDELKNQKGDFICRL